MRRRGRQARWPLMLLLPLFLPFSLFVWHRQQRSAPFAVSHSRREGRKKINTRPSHAEDVSHLQCSSCPRPRRRPRIINAATTAHTPARQAMLPVMPSVLARTVCRQIFDRAPTFDRFTHRSFFVCPVPCPCNTKPIMGHMICLYRILPMALCVAS